MIDKPNLRPERCRPIAQIKRKACESESPLTKEQWEKSEQKTKIMETAKLEGEKEITNLY